MRALIRRRSLLALLMSWAIDFGAWSLALILAHKQGKPKIEKPARSRKESRGHRYYLYIISAAGGALPPLVYVVSVLYLRGLFKEGTLVKDALTEEPIRRPVLGYYSVHLCIDIFACPFGAGMHRTAH